MNFIFKLTNDKVQDIIDNFFKHNNQNENNDNTDVKKVSSHMIEISAGSLVQNSSDNSKKEL